MKEENRYKLKVAIVSGASHALKYQQRNPRASEQEIIQHVNDMTDEIINGIELNEEL